MRCEELAGVRRGRRLSAVRRAQLAAEKEIASSALQLQTRLQDTRRQQQDCRASVLARSACSRRTAA